MTKRSICGEEKEMSKDQAGGKYQAVLRAEGLGNNCQQVYMRKKQAINAEWIYGKWLLWSA
jgi:hypothetical protein